MNDPDPRAWSASDPPCVRYRLVLFVAGDEPNSRIARANLEELCRCDIEGDCEVAEVDVLKDFETAAEHGILVTPTLLVVEPQPGTTIIGNLSNREKLRFALHLSGSGSGKRP